MLHRISEIGMALAERAAAEPTAPEAPEAPDDSKSTEAAVKQLDRIGQMLRRNAHLSERLGHYNPARRTNPDGLPRDVSRRILQRDIEEAIQECADPADAERLREDLYQRLDRPELDEDIEHRPLAQVMTEIRRDMGFEDQPGEPSWVRRTAAEWTDLCRRAASRTPPQGSAAFQLHPARFRGKPASA